MESPACHGPVAGGASCGGPGLRALAPAAAGAEGSWGAGCSENTADGPTWGSPGPAGTGGGASTISHPGVPMVRGRNERRMGLPIQSKMMAKVASANMTNTNTKKAATEDIARYE